MLLTEFDLLFCNHMVPSKVVELVDFNIIVILRFKSTQDLKLNECIAADVCNADN